MFWPALGENALEQEILAWERPQQGTDRALRDAHFLAVVGFHLVQRFRSEEAALLALSQRLAGRHRQAHRDLAGRLRALLDASQGGQDAEAGIRAFIQAWRSHHEGPLHAAGEAPGGGHPKHPAARTCA